MSLRKSWVLLGITGGCFGGVVSDGSASVSYSATCWYNDRRRNGFNGKLRLGESIGQYLIRRLREYGVRDVFGIPGDYVLGFYDVMEKSPLRIIGCTREDCAGFAADAYARVNGIGAVCVTYCVGGLSLCNSIAGAYAEKSPVVVISGAPGLGERTNNPLLHHKVKDFQTQAEVFHRLCGADAELDEPNTAFHHIDRVLDHVWRYKRPGYIELPRDLVNVVPDAPQATTVQPPASDPAALAEAVAEATQRIAAARIAGDHRRRGNPPLRPAGQAAGLRRRGRHSHREHDPRQERRQRAASAVCRAVRRRRWAARRSRGSSSRAIA